MIYFRIKSELNFKSYNDYDLCNPLIDMNNWIIYFSQIYQSTEIRVLIRDNKYNAICVSLIFKYLEENKLYLDKEENKLYKGFNGFLDLISEFEGKLTNILLTKQMELRKINPYRVEKYFFKKKYWLKRYIEVNKKIIDTLNDLKVNFYTFYFKIYKYKLNETVKTKLKKNLCKVIDNSIDSFESINKYFVNNLKVSMNTVKSNFNSNFNIEYYDKNSKIDLEKVDKNLNFFILDDDDIKVNEQIFKKKYLIKNLFERIKFIKNINIILIRWIKNLKDKNLDKYKDLNLKMAKFILNNIYENFDKTDFEKNESLIFYEWYEKFDFILDTILNYSKYTIKLKNFFKSKKSKDYNLNLKRIEILENKNEELIKLEPFLIKIEEILNTFLKNISIFKINIKENEYKIFEKIMSYFYEYNKKNGFEFEIKKINVKFINNNYKVLNSMEYYVKFVIDEIKHYSNKLIN